MDGEEEEGRDDDRDEVKMEDGERRRRGSKD
jgi:hypothetical protein